MRIVRRAVLLVALALPLVASAQTALRVSPSTLHPWDTEAFLTLYVSGLSETDTVVVRFDGEYDSEVGYLDADRVITFVPIQVMVVEGQHTVHVIVTRNSVTTTFGPGFFEVDFPDEPENPPPQLFVPEVIGAEAASAAGANVTYSVEYSGGTLSCSPASGSLFPLGSTSVGCTVTPPAGSPVSASFVVVVQDLKPPVVIVPPDITTTNPVVTFSVAAADIIDTSPEVFCSPQSGDTFPLGTTVVECYATDDFLNYGYGSFNVTVTGGPPVLTVPADITAEATSASGAVVTFTATATEGGVVACTPASGSTFALGTTTVNCTATNGSGSDSDSFTVTVVDTTPPALVLPADITAEATSSAGAAVTFVTSANDLVDGSVAVTCTPPSGSTFPLGTTLVQCSASDSRSNTANDSFSVTVADTTAPVIVLLTPSPKVLWPPDHKMVDVTVGVVSVDAVDDSPVCEIVEVSSNQPVNGEGDGDTAPDWEITGPLSLQLRAERAGSQDRTYTITVQCTDASDNLSAPATTEVRVTQQSRRRSSR